MEKGMITVGIDYYTDLVREHAVMQTQINECKRLIKSESTMVYCKDIARIFNISLDDPSGYAE